MSTTANYAATAKVGLANIATANTNRDGSGTVGNVLSAGASGSRIDGVIIQAVGATTAGMVRLFIFDGTNNRLFMEATIVAITPSGTIPAVNLAYNHNNSPEIFPIHIPTGYSLRASTNNAESFNVLAFGGDF